MSDRPSNPIALWGISLGAVLLLASVLFAIGTDERSSWGVSAIIYLSPLIRWGLLALAAASLFAGLTRIFSKLSLPEVLPRRAWIVLPILGLGLFLLRQKYPFLGDGWLLVRISEEPKSILSLWSMGRPWPLSISFFSLVHRLSVLSGHVAYQLFSVLSGVAIPVVLAWFARKRCFTFLQSFLLCLPLLASGTIALFAGYAENYPTLIVFWIFALLYTLAIVHDERMAFWPLIVAVPFLFFWHYGSLVLFPAIGFSLYLRARKKALSQRDFLLLFLSLCGFLLFVYLITPLSRGARLFLPLSPMNAADGYSLFSMRHLLDFIYEMALAAPLAPFLFLAAWISQPDLLRDSGLQVLAIAALFGTAAAFVFNPELGMARDWDLLATMLLPLNLLAGYAVARVRTSELLHGRVIGTGVVSFLIVALPFMLVNHQSEASVERYRDLLSTHTERSAYGWEILAGFMGDRGDLEERMVCLEKAAAISPNPRYWSNIANLALRLEHWERGRYATSKMRGIIPTKYLAAKNYFVLSIRFGFPDEAERMLPYLRQFAPPGEDMNPYLSALSRVKSDSSYQISTP